MTIIVVVVLVAMGVLWLGVRTLRAQTSTVAQPSVGQAAPANPKDVYMGLRNSMLQGPRSKFGLAPPSTPMEPWGVLMDWKVERGIATVVAASDGSASVYFSSGGGNIGGRGQEPIRRAAQKAVEVAVGVQPLAHLTETFPLPQRGEVNFYLLTDSGVWAAGTSDKELNSTRGPLRKLGDAMQEVITQYRLWSDQQKKAESK